MRARGLSAMVVAAVAVLALSACSGSGPEGSTLTGDGETPTASASPSPTASRSSKPPVDPSPSKSIVATGAGDRVDAQTAGEVRAFVTQYLNAQNKATGKGDFSTVDVMIKSCGVCTKSKEYITGAYKSGGKVEGGIFTQPKITVGSRRGDQIFVTVQAVVSAYKTTNGAGKVVDSGNASDETYQYTVSKIGGRWWLVGGTFVG